MSSIHSFLNQVEWDMNEIRSILETNSTSINVFDNKGLAPLHRVLKNPKCTVEIVKLFLHHGANPNLETMNGDHPIIISLSFRRDVEVIESLINVGAQVNVHDKRGHSPLCVALLNNPDTERIQILLSAGCYPTDCHVNSHSFYCLKPNTELSSEVFRMVFRRYQHIVSEFNKLGRTILCYALDWNTGLDTIKCLLEARSDLDACKEHRSALVCASFGEGPLKTETVQLLFAAGATMKVDVLHGSPLNLALEHRLYDDDAIKLMFHADLVHNEIGKHRDHILHDAVKNANCTPSIVQFLIDQGADLGETSFYNVDTPLHVAVRNKDCHLDVFRILLDHGCPVNKDYYRFGETNTVAIKYALDGRVELIELLLKNGARLAAAQDIIEILQEALDKYNANQSEENMYHFKLLMKYAYLENPGIKIRDLVRGKKHYRTFSAFEKACMEEIKVLKYNNVFQFVGRYSDYKPQPRGDQLLKVASSNDFSVYFDVLCSAFGKEAVENQLKAQFIYCNVYNSRRSRKLLLNYDITTKITSLLSDEEKFSLVVALYERKPAKYAPVAKSKKLKRKRSSKAPAKLCKR